MLSGLQVAFARPGGVASTTARTAGGAKDKQSKPMNSGTHARTNTFDNRAAQSLANQAGN